MAADRRVNLDWITIKYKDLYTLIGIVVLVLGVLGGGFLLWRWHANPQTRADRALNHAQRVLDSLDIPSVGSNVGATLAQARVVLSRGREEYRSGKYKKAFSIAKDVLTTLNDVRSDRNKTQKYAVLVDIEGSVEVKKTGQHLFSNAKDQMVLEDGDVVHTDLSSYARIKYHNGMVQIVMPDSLLMIQTMTASRSGINKIKVASIQGGVETRTPDTMTSRDEMVINTKTTTIRPAPASRVAVAQTKTGETKIAALSGSAEVEADGQTERIKAGPSGASIVSSATGLGPIKALLPPPKVLYPEDQQIIRVNDPIHYTLAFKWQPSAGKKTKFEISARALFSKLLAPDRIIQGNSITVDGLPAGSYYWRLRAAGSETETYWSPIHRFRLLQVYQRPRIKRNLKLTVVATPIGDGVILQGKTDPGVSVSVNDIGIPVNTDGSFSKIFLFSDVGIQTVQVRAFDEEGNQKVWKRQFQSVSY